MVQLIFIVLGTFRRRTVLLSNAFGISTALVISVSIFGIEVGSRIPPTLETTIGPNATDWVVTVLRAGTPNGVTPPAGVITCHAVPVCLPTSMFAVGTEEAL